MRCGLELKTVMSVMTQRKSCIGVDTMIWRIGCFFAESVWLTLKWDLRKRTNTAALGRVRRDKSWVEWLVDSTYCNLDWLDSPVKGFKTMDGKAPKVVSLGRLWRDCCKEIAVAFITIHGWYGVWDFCPMRVYPYEVQILSKPHPSLSALGPLKT